VSVAAERLKDQARDLHGQAAWHLERATVGEPAERLAHIRDAHTTQIVELCLRLVADALDEDADS
jgi:hypothetical protein